MTLGCERKAASRALPCSPRSRDAGCTWPRITCEAGSAGSAAILRGLSVLLPESMDKTAHTHTLNPQTRAKVLRISPPPFYVPILFLLPSQDPSARRAEWRLGSKVQALTRSRVLFTHNTATNKPGCKHHANRSPSTCLRFEGGGGGGGGMWSDGCQKQPPTMGACQKKGGGETASRTGDPGRGADRGALLDE